MRQFRKSWLVTCVIVLSLGLVSFKPGFAYAASDQVFTAQELAAFNGKDGKKAYYAYEGKVYDVTGSKLWKDGEHYGLQAGTDLTGKLEGAPHQTEVFAGFEIVGSYGEAVVSTPPVIKKAWYEQRIRPLGISVLGWTGIFLAVFFVLNFLTCFALPWSSLSLPWKGKLPGPDALDSAPTHLKVTSIHKYFAWGTVVIGLVHGVIGLMQLLGIYL